jgi:hypothetical protein
MEMDFHFYAVYALARASGMRPDHAFTVSYSSQHTDDAKYEHALAFENGGRFQQILTAHKYLHSKVSHLTTSYRIWIPFHFLPGNLGVDFYERMVTRSGSTVAQRLIDDLVTSGSKPYLLHRLGIFLHCFADTWSHQNFLGLVRNDYNDVKRLDVKGMDRGLFLSLLEKLKRKIPEYAAPKLGHAQAGTIPDEPFREWKYTDHLGNRHDISNVMRCMAAAQNCYQLMLKFSARFPGFFESNAVSWHNMAGRVRELFEVHGALDERVRKWKDAISAGEFGRSAKGRDAHLDYDDREWFQAAVKVDEFQDDVELYERKAGFETSQWKCFHDAGAYHLFTVLHEVLPEYGMICG